MKNSVGRLVSILYRKNQVYLDLALKPFALTASEVAFITSLFRQDGISQEELSARLCIDKAATAKAVKSLETKNYLYRVKNPRDKRANIIYLSDYAMEKREAIMAKLHEWTEFLTAGIDAKDLATMFEMMEKMVAKVDTPDFRERLGEF